MKNRVITFFFWLLAGVILPLYVLMSSLAVHAQVDEGQKTFLPVITHNVSRKHNLVGVFSQGDGNIYSIRGDGTDFIQLTGAGEGQSPVWLPDGKWISYTRCCYQAMIMKPDGSERRPLIPVNGFTEAYWSPTGNHALVIYTHCPDTDDDPPCKDFYITTPISNTVTPFLTNVDSNNFRWPPKWSPDGQKAVFLLMENTPQGIFPSLYYVNVTDQIPVRLYENFIPDAGFFETLMWSKDSQKIGFTVKPASEDDIEIFTIDVGDQIIHRVTYNDLEDNLVGWVQDNRLVVRRDYDIYLINLAGTETLFLDDLADPEESFRNHIKVHAILPDGITLLYEFGPSINLKSIETYETVTFYLNSLSYLAPPFSLSPSGRFFAYTLYVPPNQPSTPNYPIFQTIDLLSDPTEFITTYPPNHFQWTPDSRYLVVHSPSEDGSDGIFLVANLYTGQVDTLEIESLNISAVTDSWYYFQQ